MRLYALWDWFHLIFSQSVCILLHPGQTSWTELKQIYLTSAKAAIYAVYTNSFSLQMTTKKAEASKQAADLLIKQRVALQLRQARKKKKQKFVMCIISDDRDFIKDFEKCKAMLNVGTAAICSATTNFGPSVDHHLKWSTVKKSNVWSAELMYTCILFFPINYCNLSNVLDASWKRGNFPKVAGILLCNNWEYIMALCKCIFVSAFVKCIFARDPQIQISNTATTSTPTAMLVNSRLSYFEWVVIQTCPAD